MSNPSVGKDENKAEPKSGQDSATPAAAAPKPMAKTRRQLLEEEERIDPSTVAEMSVEEVDSFLEQESPEFLKSVSEIAGDKSLTVEQIIIDDAQLALNAEIDLWHSYRDVRRFLLIFPWTPHISLRVKLAKFRILAWAVGQKVRAVNFGRYLATDGKTQAIEWAHRQKSLALASVHDNVSTYQSLSRKVKLQLLVALLLTAGTAVVAYLSYKQKLIPKEKESYFATMAGHAAATFEYDPETEVEPYLNNARMSQNLYLTPKIFVNLKPSPKGQEKEGESQNPMGAFEFFVEGMSSEVVVELKDREGMTHEQFNETIHEMTFSELDTPEGKKDLTNRLKIALNKKLVSGKVRNVRIKTFIIKP